MRKTIAVITLAILVTGTFAFFPMAANAGTTEHENLWIRMRGFVDQWGEETAFGWINAHVRMINVNGTYREWAWVHAIWSNDRLRLNCTNLPQENFTFVHYAARLVNTTDVSLDASGYDLHISGLWNVTKITVSIYVDENGTFLYAERIVEPYLPELAEGELTVTNQWRGFELNINGVATISGTLVFYRYAYMEIKFCDINDDGRVDIRDIYRVARRFRLVPGTPDFDIDADLNFDGQIDIGDLSTIGASIEA